MAAIPKSKIRLLELQSIPVSSLGETCGAAQTNGNAGSSGRLSKLFKKAGSRASNNGANIKSLHSNKKREYTLNVAAWLRFGLSVDSRLASLCLSYRDASGEYVLIVEERQVLDKSSEMLSALVTLQTVGPILSLQVCCAGLKNEDRCYIEDLSIKRELEETKDAV